MLFYLLSLLTGVLECGWIAYGAVHSLPLWQILCYPLAYHVGNLFPKPFSLSRRSLIVMGSMAVITGGLTWSGFFSDFVVFLLTCATLFLLSAVIQSVRSGLKSDGNRLKKRIFRVGGFALAPVAAVIPSVTLLFCGGVALYALRGHHCERRIYGMSLQNGYSAVMVFHQLHYFFYAHITLSAMSLALTGSLSGIGTEVAALLFCLTWITYMSVEPIVGKLTDRVLPVFFAGHIGISLLLAVMSLVTNLPLFTVLWVITGFGGGVVYTISACAKESGSYSKDSMTISENIGHTLGLLTAVIVAILCKDQSPRMMLLFGSASAMAAVVCMLFTRRKECV